MSYNGLANGGNMARVIVVTSGKGGVGKTTTVCNIGCRIAKAGYSVVIIDADIGLNNVDVVMGIENRVIYDLVDVLKGKCRINEAVVGMDEYPNLYILSSSRTNIVGNNGLSLEGLTDRLGDIFDYVLIDCPAGLDVGFHRAVSSAREAIVVTTPHISAIRDADKVVSQLLSYNLADVSLVVNRVRGDLVVKGDMMDAGDISKLLALKIRGVIPEDDRISIGRQINVQGDGSSDVAYKLLTESIIWGDGKVFDATRPFRGVRGALRRIGVRI